MNYVIWVIVIIVLFFVARAWFKRREEDDDAIADLVPPPHGTPLETLVWDLVGETHRNEDGTSRQAALAKCTEGTPVTIKYKRGGPGVADDADELTEYGEIGDLRKDALKKLSQLKKHDQRTEAYIRDIKGGTEEHAIRTATLQVYVYKD